MENTALLVALFGIIGLAAGQAGTNLPPNVRPVICKNVATGADLCVNADCQTVAVGMTACICKQGTVPNQFSPLECIDFNECDYYRDICMAGPFGRCINQVGGYRCECDQRYYSPVAGAHYCERKSFFNSGLGQLLFFSNMDMEM